MPTEAEFLARMMDHARKATLAYFKPLEHTDLHETPEFQGVRLNSAFWIIAHLAVSQNGMLLFSTGGPGIKASWAKQFVMGSVPPPPEQCPPFSEVWQLFNDVHQASLKHIAGFTEEQLAMPNKTGVDFGGKNQVREVLMAAVRHDSYHCGQLGWLCKIQGKKMR